MKSSRHLLIIAVLLLCSCTGNKINLLSQEGTEINDRTACVVESTDSYVRLKNVEDGNCIWEIHPDITDWTDYKTLEWTIENKSEYPISLWVKVVQEGVGKTGRAIKEGVLFHKYMIEPQCVRTIRMDMPAPAPHPEVRDEFRLMRNSPYGRATGFHSTEIDYSKVEKIIFQDHRAITGAEWVVSDVKLVKGEKELNEIMKMTKDEFFPFIDKYGQFKYLDWPGKIESDKDLQKAREAEEKDLAAHTQMQ